jgi:putative transposase
MRPFMCGARSTQALVSELMQRFGCSQRHALRVLKMSTSTYWYKPLKKDESALKMRIKAITDTRVHYGCRRVHALLRREGHIDNVKRIYRLYREEGLSLRLKRERRNKAAKLRQPQQWAHAIKEIWSMAAAHDQERQRQRVHLQGAGQMGL